MIKTNFKINKLIRKYKQDLFLRITLSRRLSLLRVFLLKIKKKRKGGIPWYIFYKVGLVERPVYTRRKTKWCDYFFQRQKFRIFYGFLKINYLRNIIKRAFKSKNSMIHFITALEFRLDILLYRLNFVKSIRMGKNYVRIGSILINNHVVSTPSYVLKKNDFFTFIPGLVQYFKKIYFKNIISRKWPAVIMPNCFEFLLKNLIFKIVEVKFHNFFFYFPNSKYLFLNIMNFYTKKLF